ncbi:LrgB family protein [Gammaproteobacteria bacterium LSUCC0057]|uniref:LrgB family protein n=1 Tax=Gammaproteobacteria bacterium LSUCC0057 TaxID=2559237 RepID=A0A4Y8UJY0_9GAMM|nr:LrgB family protein [Gammaproteobacteria bacterium LSUCC0057]
MWSTLQQVAAGQWQLLADTRAVVLITLLGYIAGLAIYRRARGSMLLHPLLIAAPLIYLMVDQLAIPIDHYLRGNGLLTLALQLATVALALPLALQVRHLAAIWRPVLLLVGAGAVIAAVLALALAALLALEPQLLRSIAAKSITTPIAIGVTEQLGGIVAIIALSVLLTGLFGALLADWLYARCGLDDDRWQGLILGICAHGIGTAKAFETSPRCGAFATLGMGLTGIWSPLFLPWLLPLFL